MKNIDEFIFERSSKQTFEQSVINEKLTLNNQSKLKSPNDSDEIIETISNYFIMANYIDNDMQDRIKSSVRNWVIEKKRWRKENLSGPYLDCNDVWWKQDFTETKFKNYKKDQYKYFGITGSSSKTDTYIEDKIDGKRYTLAGNKDGIYFIIGKTLDRSTYYTEMVISFEYDF